MDFLIIFTAIFIVFAVLIWWFMSFETKKTFNYQTKRASKLTGRLEAALEAVAISDKKASDAHKHRLEEKEEANKKLFNVTEKYHQAAIDHKDHLDQIAEGLGTRVTRATWIDKTPAGKMAAILKKVEKLRK